MAAEALIVDDAYQRGYADAIADMRKKKRAERQREQAKKARSLRACNAGSYRAGSMGDRGRHNNSGYYRTAGAYVSFQ